MTLRNKKSGTYIMTVVRLEYSDDVSISSASKIISRINILKYTHVVKRILNKNKRVEIANCNKLH